MYQRRINKIKTLPKTPADWKSSRGEGENEMKLPFLSNQPKDGLDFTYRPTRRLASKEQIPASTLLAVENPTNYKNEYEFRTCGGSAIIANMSEVIKV